MKLVIFDMDGLMFDTEAVGARAYEDCGKVWGLETSFERYLTLIGCDKRDTCSKYRELYGQDLDAEAFYAAVGERISQIIAGEGIPVKEGLYELLDAIESVGIRKVIASSSDFSTIENCLSHAGIAERFDGIISSEEVKRGKPYPDIFLTACEKEGTKATDALVLEDSPSGIRAAIAGAIPVIAIPDLREIPPELKEKCVFVGETLKDVIPYIKSAGKTTE